MKQRISWLCFLSGALVLLNACGNQQDLVATSVAQTVTSIAAANPTATQTPFPTIIPISSPSPSPGSEQAVAPTSVSTPAPTIAPTTPPTPEPTIAPTNTNVPTLKPTIAPTSVPTPEPTIAPTDVPTSVPTTEPTIAPTTPPTEDAFIGVSFPPNGLEGIENIQGKLYLPGFDQEPPKDGNDNYIFTNRFNLRVYTYDTAVSSEDKDGAGIKEVEIQISKDGQDVFNKIESNAAYCLLGGDNPDCPILDFTKTKNWPDPDKRINQVIPIENGDYVVIITITPQNGKKTSWNFNFTIRRS
jgi:hypothetical protein